MDAYEKGELKDQKLNRKQLMCTPEFKQHHLQPLHNLPGDFQETVLQQVNENVFSLAEMKSKANIFKAKENVHKLFVRLTGLTTWEEACICFPDFSAEMHLNSFYPLSVQKLL